MSNSNPSSPNPSNSNPDSSSKADAPTSSNVTSLHGNLSKGPELEVDDDFESAADAPALETDPIEAAGADRIEAPAMPPTIEPNADATGRAETRKKKDSILTVVLGLLLLVSLGVNFLQARATARLEVQNREFETALDEAVAVLDQETLRANQAESALAEIDGAAETVRDRIDSLEQALDDLQRVMRPEETAAEAEAEPEAAE